MLKALGLQLKREWWVHCQRLGQLILPLLSFVMIAVLFPLALGASPQRLAKIGGAVVWVAVLLANIQVVTQIFREEWQSGELIQQLFSPVPLSLYWLIKVLWQWLWFLLPLLILAPIVAVLYGLSWPALTALLFKLLLATPSLMLLGALLATLTLQVKRAEALLTLLLLPLYVPILIFAVGSDVMQMDHFAQMMLCAILLAAVCFCPLLGGYLLRLAARDA
jgi:heme exporter protein B